MAFSCTCCGACCRTYWITMLPRERAAMAAELKISVQDFSSKYCQLLLQFFPVSVPQKALFVAEGDLPKKIQRKIKSKTTESAAGFIALPSIALKRKKEVCILLGKNNACLVHSSKPRQCSLFPFISLSEQPDFLLLYGFCDGLKKQNLAPKGWRSAVESHYADFSKYFRSVQEKGFKNVWGFWPKKGTLLLKNKNVCSVTEKDFFETISRFSNG